MGVVRNNRFDRVLLSILCIQEKYHALLGDLTGSEAAYLPDIVAADLEGNRKGTNGVSTNGDSANFMFF